MTTTIPILIADEEYSVRHDLRRMLSSMPGLCVAGEASDGAGVVAQANQLKPRVLLMDARIPQRSALTLLKTNGGSPASMRTLLLVQSIEQSEVVDALRFGAHGIVAKTADSAYLLNSIRSVAAGNYAFGSDVIAILVNLVSELLIDHDLSVPLKDYSLTHRELEIIAKIAAGLSNKQVAQGFSISERTVKHHLTNIFNKIGVSNRLALALFAVNNQLMTTPEPSRPYAEAGANWNSPIPSVST